MCSQKRRDVQVCVHTYIHVQSELFYMHLHVCTCITQSVGQERTAGIGQCIQQCQVYKVVIISSQSQHTLHSSCLRGAKNTTRYVYKYRPYPKLNEDKATLHNTTQHNTTTQHNNTTQQHNTTQHNTTQHIITQHNTIKYQVSFCQENYVWLN